MDGQKDRQSSFGLMVRVTDSSIIFSSTLLWEMVRELCVWQKKDSSPFQYLDFCLNTSEILKHQQNYPFSNHSHGTM